MERELWFADRSERGKLRLVGEQRAWFLDQILTQSFEDMAPGDSRDSAFLTAHGRMKAYMEIVATEDALLMHFEPELRQSLPEELGRYVFATRVDIQDVTDDFGLVLVVGPGWRDAIASAAPDAVVHPTVSIGPDGGYAWVPRSAVEAAAEGLESVGARRASEQELEEMRIAHGIPRWGREMDDKTFPQEAGIDAHAVRFDKGCYLGQEAMAKIHFRGKVNRRLARLTAPGPLAQGAELKVDDVKVGSVTSAAGPNALALVRYTVAMGDEVDAGGITATVAS
ncbi:MAG TPA: hypothetical protein VJ927_06180 [Actinomycetota bacterium]|nr:hypothetical protein [Actinomycetota bacterium]